MNPNTLVNSPERPGLRDAPADTAGRAARLAFLSTFDHARGVAAHTARLMNGLKAAAQLHGLDLAMLVLAEERAEQPCADPPGVFRCWDRQWFDTAKALDVLARERVDVLHVLFSPDLPLNSDLVGFLRTCRQRGIRLHGTFHRMDGQAEIAAETINLMDRAFVHTQDAATRFMANGAEADRLRMAPPAPTLDRFAATPAEAKSRLGLPEDFELITSFGAFAPHEGILELLQALPAVVERHPAVQFAFMGGEHAGGSGYVRECRDTVVRLGLENHVTFELGALSDEQAGRYLAASDVVVLNHTDSRNALSTAAAFVLAHCRPLVTTAMPAFVPLRDFTLQVSKQADLARAINQVLEDPQLAARLEDQARSFVEESFHLRLGELLLGEYGLLAGETHMDRPDPGVPMLVTPAGPVVPAAPRPADHGYSTFSVPHQAISPFARPA